MLSPIQFLLERVQIEVGQPWGKRTALGRAFHTGCDYPLHHRAPPQVFSDQPQPPFVPDHVCNPAYPDVVIDVVKGHRHTLPTVGASRSE